MTPNSLPVAAKATASAAPSHTVNKSPVSTSEACNRLVVALDVPTLEEAIGVVDSLAGTCVWFKVGLELFYAAGPEIVQRLRDRQLNVFLDLKLHDIPNTVASAIRSLGQLDVQLLTVHASGGAEMLGAAQRTARALGTPQLLGVTVLTSMDQQSLNDVGVTGAPANQVLRLARLAHDAGLRGMVCSPLEVASLRATLGPEVLLVVPGVRPVATPADDQKRVATPAEAIKAGASMLVVGRPITRAADPVAAASALLQEIDAALRDSS